MSNTSQQLSDEQIEDLVESVNEAAKSARVSWITLIGVIAYLFSILVSITHKDLLLLTPLKLPLIGTTVSIQKFYLIAPVVLLATHTWTVLAHVVLMGRLERFREIAQTDSRSEWYRAKLSPFLVVQNLCEPQKHAVTSIAMSATKWLVIFIAPFIVYLYFQGSYLAAHDGLATWWHRICIFVSIIMLIGTGIFVSGANVFGLQSLTNLLTFAKRFAWHLSTSIPVLFVSLFVLTTVDELNFEVPFVIGEEVDFAQRGPKRLFSRNIIIPHSNISGTSNSKAEGERLSLRNRDLRNANFVASTLDWVDLTASDLSGTDLSGTTLNGARMQGVLLLGANLTGSQAVAADLRAANFSFADLSHADFSGADAKEAIFVGTNMWAFSGIEMDLIQSKLYAADLRRANLAGSRPPPWTTDDTQWARLADLSQFDDSSAIVKSNLSKFLLKQGESLSAVDQLLTSSRLDRYSKPSTTEAFKEFWQEGRHVSGSLDRANYATSLQSYLLTAVCDDAERTEFLVNGLVSSRILSESLSEAPENFDQKVLALRILGGEDDCTAASFLSKQNRRALETLASATKKTAARNFGWIDYSKNNKRVPRVSAGGRITVQSGRLTPIYSARPRACESAAPDFRQVMERLLRQGLILDPNLGQFRDGGITSRFSNSCNGTVEARVISFVAVVEKPMTLGFSFFGDNVVLDLRP